MLISVTVTPKPKKNISFKCNYNPTTENGNAVLSCGVVPKEIRKLFSKLVSKIKFMGSLLLIFMPRSLSMCRKLVSYTCRKLASYKRAGMFPTKCDYGLNFSRIFCFTCNVQETSFLQSAGNFQNVFLVQILNATVSILKFSYKMQENFQLVNTSAGKFPAHKCKMLHKCRKISCTYCKNQDFLVKCRKHDSCTSTSKYRCT